MKTVLENRWTDEQIVEWVTIITIFLFACFPHNMIELSETSLGKLFFTSIIVYYAMVDPVYGIIACALVIVYYHLDLYKNLIAVHRDTLYSDNSIITHESMTEMKDNDNNEECNAPKTLESYVSGESDIYSYTSHSEPFDYYESEFLKGQRKKELLDNFRRTNCDDKNRLKNKGGVVHKEMTDHVFREVQFPNNSAKCNPCDESCEFSIIEERIAQEETLRSTSSNEEPIDWNKLFGHYLVKPVESMAEDISSSSKWVSSVVSHYTNV